MTWGFYVNWLLHQIWKPAEISLDISESIDKIKGKEYPLWINQLQFVQDSWPVSMNQWGRCWYRVTGRLSACYLMSGCDKTYYSQHAGLDISRGPEKAWRYRAKRRRNRGSHWDEIWCSSCLDFLVTETPVGDGRTGACPGVTPNSGSVLAYGECRNSGGLLLLVMYEQFLIASGSWVPDFMSLELLDQVLGIACCGWSRVG